MGNSSKNPHLILTTHLFYFFRYVNTANQIIQSDRTLKKLTLEQIIESKEIREKNGVLFNNAAQSWNHAFYWKCMAPPTNGGGGEPDKKGMLAKMIKKDFGSFKKFRAAMETAALTAFGSGWAWLCYDKKKKRLVVMKTVGAGNPLADGIVPILTIDVWEHGKTFTENYFSRYFLIHFIPLLRYIALHLCSVLLFTISAYYLDYQEKRNAYVTAFFDSLANWSFAEENFKRATESNDSDEK